MTTTQHMLLLDGLDPRQLDASHESDGWYTPRWIVDAAREVMGGIDVDPASCAAAQAVVQATTWYTQTENGLVQPWRGRVWVNPPYSHPLPWVDRLINGYMAGDITAGMMLVNCSCSPKWAQRLWRQAHAVCLFDRRLDFWHPTKANANNSYDRDSALFYFGANTAVFERAFRRYGVVRTFGNSTH